MNSENKLGCFFGKDEETQVLMSFSNGTYANKTGSFQTLYTLSGVSYIYISVHRSKWRGNVNIMKRKSNPIGKQTINQ